MGHKAAECTEVGVNEVGEGEPIAKDECSVEIGRVWNVCCLECRGPEREEQSRFAGKNRFASLLPVEEVESEGVSDSTYTLDQSEGKGEDVTPRNEFKAITRKKRKWLKPWFPCFGDTRDMDICSVENGEKIKMCLGFQVADVKKPLIAVKRIVDNGNKVSFGPGDGDNYILNMETEDKMMLKPNGKGSYLMDVSFVGGGRTQITVDSGAEENVCPWEWGLQFGTKPVEKWMNFRNASGGNIPHWGKRDVFVESSF